MIDYFCSKGNTDVDNLLLMLSQDVCQDSNRYLHSPIADSSSKGKGKGTGKVSNRIWNLKQVEKLPVAYHDSSNGEGGIAAQKVFFN